MVQYPEAAADMEKENVTGALIELQKSSNQTVVAFASNLLCRLSGDAQAMPLPSNIAQMLDSEEFNDILDFPLDDAAHYTSQSTPARYHSNPGSELASPIGTPQHPYQIPRPFTSRSMPASAAHSMPPSAPHSLPPSAPHSLPPSAPHSLPPSNPQSMPGSGTQTPVHPFMQPINHFTPDYDVPVDYMAQTTSTAFSGPPPQMHQSLHVGPPTNPPPQTMTVHHHPSYNSSGPSSTFMQHPSAPPVSYTHLTLPTKA